MHQLINEEDTNGPTLAVDLKARFTNQQMEEKHGEKSVQVYQKKIWDALDWQYHPLMLTMSMQLWKDVMEKVDFTVQQTKGLHKVTEDEDVHISVRLVKNDDARLFDAPHLRVVGDAHVRAVHVAPGRAVRVAVDHRLDGMERDEWGADVVRVAE